MAQRVGAGSGWVRARRRRAARRVAVGFMVLLIGRVFGVMGGGGCGGVCFAMGSECTESEGEREKERKKGKIDRVGVCR